MSKQLIFTRRVTSQFLLNIPAQAYTAYLYVVVGRAPEAMIPEIKYGSDVRIDPCYFDWNSKTITFHIPYNINPGITKIEDLDPNFYESVEAAFIALLYSVAS